MSLGWSSSPVGKKGFFTFTTSYFGWLTQNSPLKRAWLMLFFSQVCVGSEELDDKNGSFFLVPLLVTLVITLITDLFTFSSKQYSTQPTEYYSLSNKYKICCTMHTIDHKESTVEQKVDIPLKCTPLSYILSALICLFHNFIVKNISDMYMLFLIPWLFFTAVNIPMVVCLSTRNNFTNIMAARQRNNTIGWNRTQRQQWEINCALKDRIQNEILETSL